MCKACDKLTLEKMFVKLTSEFCTLKFASF